VKLTLTVLALFLLQAVIPAATLYAQAPRAEDENEVKAQIILNLPLVANWPEGTLPDDGKVRLCTLSDGKVSHYLKLMAAQPSYADHIVFVPHIRDQQVRQCQVLFFDKQDAARMEALLETIGQAPVLTVGTTRNFARQKGMIGFLNTQKSIGLFSQKNVKFEINMRQTSATGITLDPLLLELAEKIIPEGGTP